MGMFEGIGKAKTFRRGSWFHTGMFLIECQAAKGIKTRAKGDAFILEHRVLAVLDAPPETKNLLRPGGAATHMTTSDKDNYWSNIREMVGQLLVAKFPEENPDLMSDEDWDTLMADDGPVVGSKQIFAGLLLIATAAQKTTQKGKDFTVITYTQGVTARQARELLASQGVDEKVLYPSGELQKRIEQEEAAEKPAA